MKNLWREEDAEGLAGVDLLVHRSRLIGRERGLVAWGGGNTSIKHREHDFRGREISVMRIKGSGVDLETAEPRHFPGIRLEDLEPLRTRRSMSDDEMVAYLAHCVVEPDSLRPSIETLLHGLIPAAHVDHTHADAVLALTNTVDGKRNAEAVFGEEMIWIPYRRPGFALSREVGEAVRKQAKARCVILERHGLITWGDTAKASYDATIEMSTRAEEFVRGRLRGRKVFGAAARPALRPADRRRVVAEVAPFLRGLLSGRGGGVVGRTILRFDDGEDVLDFVGSEMARRISLTGPATPDHILYTKSRPLFVDGPAPEELERPAGITALRTAMAKGMEKYLAWYEVYFKKHGSGREVKLDPHPRVVLIPGVGMVTAWKDAKHARIVAEAYRRTIHVMRAAQSIGEYRSLSIKDTFDVEYWPMEQYRLTLAPPERSLARRVAMVTGAASGIGRAIAQYLAAEGCHVVATDRDLPGVEVLAREISEQHGPERGLALAMDVTDEASVAVAFEKTVLAYGGLDVVVSNAGIAHCCRIERMARADWQRSFDVNAMGHFLVSREALRILKEQGIGGSLVFVASKNVLAPGKDFGAYSASKAAECQLARVLAIEGGEYGVRVNVINPDAVFQGSRLWSAEVREERAKAHGVRPGELEEFYRRRNLLGVRVSAEDVAEAAVWLATDRSAKTTGCIITVDGGVREAFPR